VPETGRLAALVTAIQVLLRVLEGIVSSSQDCCVRDSGPIQIGLVTNEPIRLAGLATIFEQPIEEERAQLVPVTGSISALLANYSLRYLIVDLNSSSSGLELLDTIRSIRPEIRLIVIGPAGNDELIIRSIIAGARAYLDLKEGPELVRSAIQVVIEGSIWAPRRLLSRLIDRLLKGSDAGESHAAPRLTARELQVMELILMARSNREIAAHLGIEERTVRAHLASLMRKAGVDNRIKLSISARSVFQLPPVSGVGSAEAWGDEIVFTD
jgi:DNA-binding NarL/FixJ family response regulator